MTTQEVKKLLGLQSDTGAMEACRRARVDERKVPGPYNSWMCLWRREQVEGLAATRQREGSMKSQGLKRCTACGRWKDAEHEFWTGQAHCTICASAENKARWQRKQARKKAQPAPADAAEPGARLADVLGISAGPAKPMDSLKYACMDVGFAHRGVPHGQTKRQAFCSRCTAARCIHHPELTPEQVRMMGRLPTEYPEHVVASHAEGR